MTNTISYYSKYVKEELLSKEEELKLGAEMRCDDDKCSKAAREKMICANMRLVMKIAKKWRRKGILLDDLVEEGIIGLIRAVEGYNPSYGLRFATYATYWINQTIQKSITDKANTIRVPAYIYPMIREWKKAEAELKLTNKYPTNEEIAKKAKITILQIDLVLSAMKLTSQCDETNIDDCETKGVIDQITLSDEIAELSDSLEKLEQREKFVIVSRFGINTSKKTLLELATTLGITRERVRQIETLAINKLNNNILYERLVNRKKAAN